MNIFENQNLRYQFIEEGLDELNYYLKLGNYDVSILEKITVDTYADKLREKKEIFVFKPKFENNAISQFPERKYISIFAKQYFVTKGVYWTNIISDGFEFPQKYLQNVNPKKINPLKEDNWNGIKIYVNENLERHIEENFKTNIGFHRKYNLLKKIL